MSFRGWFIISLWGLPVLVVFFRLRSGRKPLFCPTRASTSECRRERNREEEPIVPSPARSQGWLTSARESGTLANRY